MHRTPQKAGSLLITGATGRQLEADTATCRHCGAVFIVRSTRAQAEDPGGWCWVCAGMICPACVGHPCVPLEKRLAVLEGRERLFRRMGLG